MRRAMLGRVRPMHVLFLAALLTAAWVYSSDYRTQLPEALLSRCSAEIAELKRLEVDYAVVAARGASFGGKNFMIAVYDSHGPFDDIVSRRLLENGHWEGEDASNAFTWTEKNISPQRRQGRKVAADIGANVGFWTLLGASMGWEMVAVDGMPRNIALIKLSLCLNPELAERVKLHEALLGDKVGPVCIIYSNDDNVGDASVECELDGQAVEWTDEQIAAFQAQVKTSRGVGISNVVRRPIETLDDIFDKTIGAGTVIGFMKIDVEGSEYRVLQGTGRWLREKAVLSIFSEIWQTIRGGPVEYLRHLADMGYAIWAPRVWESRKVNLVTDAHFAAFAKMRPLNYFSAVLPEA